MIDILNRIVIPIPKSKYSSFARLDRPMWETGELNPQRDGRSAMRQLAPEPHRHDCDARDRKMKRKPIGGMHFPASRFRSANNAT